MNTQEDLMQRLAVSKKIMDKHTEIKRGDVRPTMPMVENYEPVNATYNLPQDVLSESTSQQKPYHDPTKPVDMDRILNSKLPDEIKQLMYEHPIVQPQTLGSATISDDVIAGAQRLMGKTNNQESSKQTANINLNESSKQTSNINISEIKNMIRDVVRDTVRDVVKEELRQSGMIVESSKDVSETIQFKVGNTLFTGKVTKIKQMTK
jgi:hypothetical protein